MLVLKVVITEFSLDTSFRSFQALIPVTEIFYLSKRARIQVIKAHRRHFKHILHTFRCLFKFNTYQSLIWFWAQELGPV